MFFKGLNGDLHVCIYANESNVHIEDRHCVLVKYNWIFIFEEKIKMRRFV